MLREVKRDCTRERVVNPYALPAAHPGHALTFPRFGVMDDDVESFSWLALCGFDQCFDR
jgi:hypothetical protein